MPRMLRASLLLLIGCGVLFAGETAIEELHYVVDAGANELRAFVPEEVTAADRAPSRKHVIQARRIRGLVTIEIDGDKQPEEKKEGEGT